MLIIPLTSNTYLGDLATCLYASAISSQLAIVQP